MIGGATFVPASTAAHAELVHATRLPLIVLERHDARVDPMLLDRARQELLRGCDAEGALRSGFLLGMQADARTHPACLELARSTQARLLGVPGRARGPSFSLSFLKLAEARS